MSTLPAVPAPILTLAERVAERGGRAWLVGGGVRDHLTGAPVKDWDIEVFGLDAEVLLRLLKRLGKVNAVGRSFGVFKLRPRHAGPDEPEIDVSIPRRDSKVGPGHRGIAVAGDPDMTLEEAARRRDLTINAILVDLLTGEVADPFGGRRDLDDGVLRAVDDTTFLEDPLRALRVVQFAARLAFRVDPSLEVLCRRAELHELPAERIQGEWGKLLLRSRRPSIGLQVARRCEILSRVFPEALPFDGEPVDRCVDAVAAHRDALEPEGRRWALMLAAWLHRADDSAIQATLDRMWMHRLMGYPVRDRVAAAVAHWPDPHATEADLRRMSTVAEPQLALLIAHGAGAPDALSALARAEALGVQAEPPAPLLKGRDLRALGVPPGPEMGRLLDAVYARQLEGDVCTLEEARGAARHLLEAPDRGGHGR